MKKLLFIVNAHAGKGQIREKMVDILDTFIKADYQLEVYLTQNPGDAVRIAAERGAEMDRVVASGGDGTLDEVVNGLMRIPYEQRPSLGYISAGTTNDFAHSVKIPRNMAEAAVIAAGGEKHTIDIGKANDQYFCYVYGFGAFTDISYVTPQNLKKALGHPAYIITGAQELMNLKPTHMRVEANGQVWEDNFLCGLVSNSEQIGGMPGVWGKDISLQDGLLEVTLIRLPERAEDWGELVADFFTGSGNSKDKIQFKTDHIHFCSEEEVSWVKDGEFGGEYTNMDIQCLHEAMTLAVTMPSGRLETENTTEVKANTVQ